MVFCVREIEALRLLGWCQYIRPAQLLRLISETELSNLLTMKLIKYHSKSEALILTAEGRRLLAGTIWLPDTPRTYHADAVVRRLRLASLLLTAYQSGINVYTTQPDELAEGNGPLSETERETVCRRLESLAEHEVTSALEQMRAWKADCAELGPRAALSDPGLWSSLESDWPEVFSRLEPEVTVRADLPGG